MFSWGAGDFISAKQVLIKPFYLPFSLRISKSAFTSVGIVLLLD